MGNGAVQNNPFEETISEKNAENILVLYDDDVHTFEYVIKALIDICNHNSQQAEQCAMITHFKGRCGIKNGEYNTLKLLKDKLIALELTVSIE